MSDIDIKLIDNSGEILRNFQKNLEAGLEAIGLQAERYAKEGCPVDTGRLRNSITHTTAKNAGQSYSYSYKTYTKSELDKMWGKKGVVAMRKAQSETAETHRGGAKPNEVYVGTNVEYAIPQETNDRYKHTVGGAHFLKNAAANHGDVYEKILKKQLKGT